MLTVVLPDTATLLFRNKTFKNLLGDGGRERERGIDSESERNGKRGEREGLSTAMHNKP